MGLSRGVHTLSACLVLMFGGVLSKSIMSLDFNSPCPDQWYYLGGDTCAYVITSNLPSRNLQLFCQQLDAHLQLIEDKPVCLKRSRQNHLFYGDDETANTDDDKVYKRVSYPVFGNPGLGR